MHYIQNSEYEAAIIQASFSTMHRWQRLHVSSGMALLIRLSSDHSTMHYAQILLLCCVDLHTTAGQHGMAYLISASCGHTDKQEVKAGAPVVLPLNDLIIDLGQHVEVVFP